MTPGTGESAGRDAAEPAGDGAAEDAAGVEGASGSLGRRFAPDEARCELCGEPQLDRHCKVVCPRCGFVRDCSDP